MKRAKEFAILWALILAFICGVGLATYLLRLLGLLAVWLSPSYGPYILVTLLVSAIVAACVVGSSREKAGGAPY